MNPVDTNSTAKNGPMLSAGDSQLLQAWKLSQGEGASHEPPGLSSTPTMSALWQSLQRRWLLAVGIAVGATALAIMAVFFVMPPQFHTSFRVRVAKHGGSDDSSFVMFTANMEALVKSPLVLSAALNDKTVDGRDIKDLELVRRHGVGAVEWLEKDLKTDFKLGPEVLRVTLPSDMPEDAAQLLTAINKAFLNEYAQTEAAKKQARLAELRSKKERIEEDLRGLRLALDRMYKSLDVKGRDEANLQMQQWANKIAAAEADKRANDLEISRTQSDIETYKARLKNIDQQKIPDAVLGEVYGKDATIQLLEKKMLEIDLEIGVCKRKYPENIARTAIAPLQREKESVVRSKTEREAELKPKIEASWRKQSFEDMTYQVSVNEEKVINLLRRRESLQNEIRDLEVKAKNVGSGQRPPQILALEEKIDLTKKSLEWTAQKISDVELEQASSRITPLEPPGIPLDKDRTRQTKIAGAGGLAVFVFALFGVAFIEFRSRKIGVAAEVAQGLGLNVLGTIPAMPVRTSKNDPAAAEKWQAQLNESVDAIRTVILHQSRSEPLHVLMVTSAQKGEGKTTLATQLAASLSRAWKRVLVIDGDLRHPATHVLFDTPQEPGLSEVLRGEVEAPDAIRATPFARLWLLPAGNGDAHAIQALAQDNVRTLFESLKQQYDFIIIDSPPVLPVTDSLLLGQHVDALLFAVLSEVSRAPAIHAAQQKLAPLNVRTLGSVVLGAPTEFSEKNYGYALNQAK